MEVMALSKSWTKVASLGKQVSPPPPHGLSAPQRLSAGHLGESRVSPEVSLRFLARAGGGAGRREPVFITGNCGRLE